MKKILLFVVTIALLISACSSDKASEAKTPSAIKESQAQSNEAMVEPTTEVTNTAAVDKVPSATQTPQALDEPTASAEAQNVNQPTATRTPYPTRTPYSTFTPRPTNTPTAPETPEQATVEETISADAPTTTPAPGPAQPAQTMPVKSPATSTVELTRIEDPDPAPPLTILVSAVRVAQNGYYKVTGTVRNDSPDTYGGVGVVAIFYEEATPCSEREVTRRRWDGTEETVIEEVCDYNWHGPVKVYAACMSLEPGAECPFSLEIYPEDYVSYLLHPEGTPVEYRQPASLALSNLNAYNNGLGYVRITGTATNGNPFTVRDANIAGTLIDANGQIVSVGSIIVPGEIAPGASVDFDLRIEYASYVRYQLSAQAIQN
jgi:hypothetical protein